jgi:hypothetical protein
MSLRLVLLERWLPDAIRRAVFRRLARLTAAAFDTAPPDLDLAPHDAVARFGRFTSEEAARVLAAGPAAASTVRDRLFSGARDLGDAIRRGTAVRTADDAVRALRLLYRAIGIDFEGCAASGDVVISSCAFSRLYTPEVCALVSALDDGVVAGLTGGGRLAFEQRLTEGGSCCRGHLRGGPFR